MEAARPQGTSRRGPLVAAIALVAAVGAAYSNTFRVPYLLDDVLNIQTNQSIRTLWPLSVPLSPPPLAGVGGRPLLNLTFALTYAGAGQALWAYHLGNLIIHCAAALVLFGIIRRTVGHTATAFAGALLWGVHPLATEAVTYLSERAESLMGLFYFLTLYAFIVGAHCGQCAGNGRPAARPNAGGRLGESGAKRSIWFVVSVLSCLCGMATKEVMVTAPLAVLLYDRAFLSSSWRALWKARWPIHLALASTWLLLAWLMRDVGRRDVGYRPGVTAWTYLLTEAPVVLDYLRLAAWPAGLVFYHNPRFAHALAPALPWLALATLLVAGTAALYVRRPRLGYAPAMFFLTLAPTSSIVPVLNQPMAEHRLYVPLAALIAAVVVLLHRLLGRFAYGLFAAAGLLLLALTHARNAVYGSELALWQDNAKQEPANSYAQNNLGMSYLHLGRLAEAIEHCTEAVRLDPANERAYNNLGYAFVAQGRFPDALAEFRKAIELKPEFSDAWSNLGGTLNIMGRFKDAVGPLQQALRFNPENATAHYDLGNALASLGHLSEGVAEFERALALRPDYAAAEANLGGALFLLKRYPEAVAHCRRALALDPRLASAWNNLGAATHALGLPESLADYRRAVRLEPGSRQYRQNLAAALKQAGGAPP